VNHPSLEKLFHDNMDDPLSIIHECTSLELFYEYKRNGILYQAHPDYLSMGAWYD